MYQCSFKGFRLDLYSDHTNIQTDKQINFHKYRHRCSFTGAEEIKIVKAGTAKRKNTYIEMAGLG